METSLENKTVLVTGATAGFGKACAERFARAGARLVLVGRRAERLEALRRDLPVPSLAAALDVRDRAAVERFVAGLPSGFGEVEVLVNNAGLALGLAAAQAASLDDWEQMLDTNCRGLMVFTRALLPGMVARGRGHVVNVGSVAASYPYPGGNVYGATKAFVHQFSQNLKSDLAGTGVRVTVIEPGMAETEFSLVRMKGDAEKAKAVYAGMQPLTAEDVADAVFWVATRPAHVNVNVLELMPQAQGFGPFTVKRG